MRYHLGVLLMEEKSGEVAVQLFAEIPSAVVAFDNLAGKPGDPERRATFLELHFDGGELRVRGYSKMLPVIESTKNRPDGVVLGEGPVTFDKP